MAKTIVAILVIAIVAGCGRHDAGGDDLAALKDGSMQLVLPAGTDLKTLPIELSREIEAGRIAVVFETPAEALLKGGRQEWRVADERTRQAAAEQFVRERHPTLSGHDLIFRAGFVCGRIDVIYEQQTVQQMATLADDMYAEQFESEKRNP